MKTANQHEAFKAVLAETRPDVREKIESLIASAGSVEIVFNECGKVKYGHRETAETAAEAMHRKTGDSYDVYQCVFCGDAWHIGHARG